MIADDEASDRRTSMEMVVFPVPPLPRAMVNMPRSLSVGCLRLTPQMLVVPRPGAFLAISEQLHAASSDPETMSVGHLAVRFSAVRALEFNDLAAIETNQVLVLP